MMNSRAVDSEPEVKKGDDGQRQPPAAEVEKESFAEMALKLGGKSAEEARRTGAFDKADDQVEALFAPQYQTVNSPAHRAVWDAQTPINEFISTPAQTPPHVQKVMDDSLAVVRKHVQAGTLLNTRPSKASPRKCSTSWARPATGDCWSVVNTAARRIRSRRSLRS